MAKLAKKLGRLLAREKPGLPPELDKRLARIERRQMTILRLLQRQAAGDSPLYDPACDRHAYGIYSKQGEDGQLLHLLTRIGPANRRFVEIGIQDGTECNTANLALNFGWGGVLVEGDPEHARAAERLYSVVPGVKVLQAFVTRENVNALLAGAGAHPECDLFSIDVDGNDYWIWEALSAVRPRLVVAEYNSAFGPERSIAVPYAPDFRHRAKHPRYYYGASLAALARLAERKGYLLAGGSDAGNNAFFVRRDGLASGLRAVSVAEAFRPVYFKRHGDELLKAIADLEYVEIV